MTDYIDWPICLLGPRETDANLVPFTRGGGRSLGGLERAARTDRGYWSVSLNGIIVRTKAQKKTWNAIRVKSSGRSGVFVVPVKSWDTAPYSSGKFEPPILTVHDDDTEFDDGSSYLQGAIDIEMETEAAISDTVVTLRRNVATDDLVGIRFSYQNALYETGPAIDVDGDLWTVSIFPSIRATIPAGSSLECDNPTCLMRLAEDRGLDLPQGKRLLSEVSVSFVEACDVWNDLAEA
jgi:hypothetical protein